MPLIPSRSSLPYDKKYPIFLIDPPGGLVLRAFCMDLPHNLFNLLSQCMGFDKLNTCMKIKYLYLILAVLGTLIPYIPFIEFLMREEFNPSLFVAQASQTPIASFFTLDVLVSSFVVIALVLSEGRKLGMKNLWIYYIQFDSGSFTCSACFSVCQGEANGILIKYFRPSSNHHEDVNYHLLDRVGRPFLFPGKFCTWTALCRWRKDPTSICPNDSGCRFLISPKWRKGRIYQ